MFSGQQRSNPKCSQVNRQRGFTLQELVVSLAIGSGVTTGATGAYVMVQETKLTAAVNELVTHLNLARSEAVTRGEEVVVCPSADAKTCADAGADNTWWTSGYLVYVDANDNGALDATDTIVRVTSGTQRDLTVKSSRHRAKVTFQPTGLAGGSTITFAFCDSRGASGARYVTVQNGGRARVSSTTASTVRCA